MQELFPLPDSYRKKNWKKNIFMSKNKAATWLKIFVLELFKGTDMEEDMDKESEPFLEKSE